MFRQILNTRNNAKTSFEEINTSVVDMFDIRLEYD